LIELNCLFSIAYIERDHSTKHPDGSMRIGSSKTQIASWCHASLQNCSHCKEKNFRCL